MKTTYDTSDVAGGSIAIAVFLLLPLQKNKKTKT